MEGKTRKQERESEGEAARRNEVREKERKERERSAVSFLSSFYLPRFFRVL